MAAGAGQAALEPTPALQPKGAEAEALRRFRSFAVSSLGMDRECLPSLEGLRVGERRAAHLLGAWIRAASESAGPDGPAVRAALLPLADRFRLALRSTQGARRASGAPRPSRRRAVSAAIDRVGDAFFALDADTGAIADANPAAGALLGTTRDALLGRDAMSFVPDGQRNTWWAELDAVTEGAETRRFRASLRDVRGQPVPVETSVTRFATRQRTLALCVARALNSR